MPAGRPEEYLSPEKVKHRGGRQSKGNGNTVFFRERVRPVLFFFRRGKKPFGRGGPSPESRCLKSPRTGYIKVEQIR